MESASAIMKFERTPLKDLNPSVNYRQNEQKVLSNSKQSIEACREWMVANCGRDLSNTTKPPTRRGLKKVYKKVMPDEEVEKICNVLKGCSKLKQVKVAMQV